MADNDNRYPRPWWDPSQPIQDGINPAYAHSKEDEEHPQKGFRARGWTDVYANYPKDEHHRRLYKADGSSVVCFSAAQERALTEEGYSRTPVAAIEKAEPVAEPPVLVLKEKRRIDALEEQVREIASGQNELAATQALILEELSKLNSTNNKKKAS